METIRITGDDVKIGDAIEIWQDAGICRDCINYRLSLNRTFHDSYEDFGFAHCEDCMC